MGSDYLKEKFPEMRPTNGAPAMFTLNGVGTKLYGERDYDDETGTHVATLCVVVLFIPVFMLSAYRVARAGGRKWYFLGKVPLSGLARSYNYAVGAIVALGIVGVGVSSYLDSPGYRAGQRLDEAAEMARAGKVVEAAHTYGEVARGATSHAGEAKEDLAEMVDKRLDDVPLAKAAGVLQQASQAHALGAKALVDRGLGLVKAEGDDQPDGTVAVLDVITPRRRRRRVFQAAPQAAREVRGGPPR